MGRATVQRQQRRPQPAFLSLLFLSPSLSYLFIFFSRRLPAMRAASRVAVSGTPLPHWLWYTREISGQDLVHPFASCPAENLRRESPLQPIEMFLLSLKWIPRVGKQGEHRANDRGEPPPLPHPPPFLTIASLLRFSLSFRLVFLSCSSSRPLRAQPLRGRARTLFLLSARAASRNPRPILLDPLNVSREPC